jgi:hypothetical protein
VDKLIAILRTELESWECGWSIGSFGAIGEFHQDEGEELHVDATQALARATARGAIRIVPRPDMTAVAYELLSPRAHRWSQGAILAAHPHRVVISHLGRAEVYQKIGGPETGGVSPAGPHTHVLPNLLAARRTHSANTPIPDGLVPCAFLHPANPVMTTLGGDKPFNGAQFAAFQAYLDLYGPPPYVETKRRVWAALDAARDPASIAEPETRLERTALRNALRQAARQSEAAGDAARAARIAAWRAHFDNASEPEQDEAA